ASGLCLWSPCFSTWSDLLRIAFRGGFGYGWYMASTKQREGPMAWIFEHRSRGPVHALWLKLQG
ncbi:MAG: hypothetical protein JWP99_10, partial [Devosia sp.]|nr:hypothetical protein [Devosia sp.]